MSAPAVAAEILIVLHPQDNVAIASRELTAGETVGSLTVGQRVPECHKVARIAIASGDPIRKYAQVIGYASCDIPAGHHVHVHNVEYRDSSTIAKDAPAPKRAGPAQAESGRTFMGYRRADGGAATRNFIGIFSSVNCSATVANRIADHFTEERLAAYTNVDGVVAFAHGTGCGMVTHSEGFENLRRVMAGYIRHPNVGAALLVGLGCETNQISSLTQKHGLGSSDLFRTMNIQDLGGSRATLEAGIRAVEDMLPVANRCERETCPAADLTLALQCGGSDAWSGVTANPALGYAADMLVAAGGTAVLAETPEIYGAEHLLLSRVSSEQVAEQLMERIRWWEEHTASNGVTINYNLAPGNQRGGLTTILEKSLGAVAKGGTSTLQAVYRYAEPVAAKGFVFMDSPGYDPVSVTGEVAAGCNIVAFTTGRGSAFGCKPAPSVKICSNPRTYERMSEDMDINAGLIAIGEATVPKVGEQIFERILAVASGEPSRSESNGFGDFEFVPWQVGATM